MKKHQKIFKKCKLSKRNSVMIYTVGIKNTPIRIKLYWLIITECFYSHYQLHDTTGGALKRF